MVDEESIEQFQRWLQARLPMAEQIEDPAERNRALQQIESAIQLAIQYGMLLSEADEEVPSPFVERDTPVRVIEDASVTSNNAYDESVCTNCEADLSGDLDFCPACGEFR
uniref:Uncharacterized protein n=1 Tax=uncultured marine group II/III euryarchaeote AD1000_28_D03 TaxID=1457747 RepID=A0A075FNK1_9EURY|nr:hypothetical protein [uncultured marine group II/III euryarchaeote AD1000_28_D03]